MKKILLFAIFSMILIITGCDEDTNKISRMNGLMTGLEVQLFKESRDMEINRPAFRFDTNCSELIRKVDELIKQDHSLYSQENLELFEQLLPYRQTVQVQKAIDKWSDLLAAKLKTDYRRITKEMESSGASTIRDYAAKHNIEIPVPGSISEAIDILQAFPYSVEARNNLALLHLQPYSDLIILSQLDLETIHKLTEGAYYPAAINLTVALEMNKQFERAQELAFESFEKWSQIPQVRYNAAWYKFQERKFAEVKELLKPIVEIEMALEKNDKGRDVEPVNFYRQLYEIISPIEYVNKSFLELGIAEKYLYSWESFKIFDFRIDSVMIVYVVGLFLLGAGLFHTIDDHVIIATIVLFAIVAYYICWWGIPGGFWGWIFMLANPLFAAMLGAVTSPETWDG